MQYLELEIKTIFNIKILIIQIDGHKIEAMKLFLNKKEFEIFENKENIKGFFKNENSFGITMFGYSETYEGIVIFKKNKDIKKSTNTLFHELEHVKYDILNSRNIEDVEMNAWLMGWLSSEVIHNKWKSTIL